MVFCWISAEGIPEQLDLRQQGWALVEPSKQFAPVALVHAPGIDDAGWSQLIAATRPETRQLMIVAGVNNAPDRANLLSQGFGDAIGDETHLVEVSARARRLAELRQWLPRRRRVAGLELDLMARDAACGGIRLGLLPREFDILWRLADTPDTFVSKETLLHDIWRIGIAPESNSIAVHISRLRAKLSSASLEHLLEGGRGGYRLRLLRHEPWETRLADAHGGLPTLRRLLEISCTTSRHAHEPRPAST